MMTLKRATRPHHAQLECRTDLMNPTLSLVHYQNVLQNFYAYYAALEPLLFASEVWVELGFRVEERRKLPWLERDLDHFGLERPVPVLAPFLPSFAHHLGALYVVEGATLGGQLIGRHLERTLGLTPDHGATFFNGYGAATGKKWQEVCTLLTEQAKPPHKDVEIVAGAVLIFSGLDALLAGRASS